MPRSPKPTPSQPPAVRYYPRRRPAPPANLTPSQALHLASDPARADRARRTAERRQLHVTPSNAGWVRRWLGRLRRD